MFAILSASPSSDRRERRALVAMHMGMANASGFLLFVAALAACGSPPPTLPSMPALEVSFDGCADLLGSVSRPQCVLCDDHELRLWVETDDGAEIRIGDGSGESPGDPLFEIEVGADTGYGRSYRLTGVATSQIRVQAGMDPDSHTWTLAVQRDLGDRDPACRLEKKETPEFRKVDEGDLEKEERGLWWSDRARRFEWAGERDKAVSAAREAIRIHQEDGRLYRTLYDTTYLIYLLYSAQ